MEVTARKFGLHEGEKEDVFRNLMQGGALTLWGLSQRRHACRAILCQLRPQHRTRNHRRAVPHPARRRREGDRAGGLSTRKKRNRNERKPCCLLPIRALPEPRPCRLHPVAERGGTSRTHPARRPQRSAGVSRAPAARACRRGKRVWRPETCGPPPAGSCARPSPAPGRKASPLPTCAICSSVTRKARTLPLPLRRRNPLAYRPRAQPVSSDYIVSLFSCSACPFRQAAFLWVRRPLPSLSGRAATGIVLAGGSCYWCE